MSFIPSVYTVESVRRGHPDKVCDYIADSILDECLRQDPLSRTAVEVFGTSGLLVIGGEVTTRAIVDYAAIARRTYREIGYTDNPEILVRISEQSPDIAQGVDTGGAGDQGIMYGYATDETPEFLPRGLVLVRNIMQKLDNAFHAGTFPWLGPDGKAQITMNHGKIKTVLVSCQHGEDVSIDIIRKTLHKVSFADSRELVNEYRGAEILINPTGRFVRGGFAADTGLTGRKLMVDTYGGLIAHGGGALAGKDPTKVDRSGALMARHVAKELVRQGLGHEALVSVAYAIGRAEPVMLTAQNEAGQDLSTAASTFDFRPRAIIEHLNLRTPCYSMQSHLQ